MLVLAVSLLAFDYRGLTTGGGYVQYLAFLGALTSCVLYVTSKYLYGWRPKLGLLGLIALISVFWSLLVQLYYGNPWDSYFRVAAPFILMLVGIVVGQCAIDVGDGERLIVAMLAGVLVSVGVSYFNGVVGLGAPAVGGRYFVLSPVAIPGAGLAMIYLGSRQHFRALSLAVLTSSLIVAILSATRSQILAIVIVIIAARLLRPRIEQARVVAAFKELLALTAFAFVVAAIGYQFEEIREIWLDRLLSPNEHGIDLTVETRKAEIAGQWELLTRDVETALTGLGWGSEYYWSGTSLELVRSVLGWSYYGDVQFEAGHNFWIYSLYSQGFVFGTLSLLLPVIAAAAAARTLWKAGSEISAYLGWIGLVASVGFLVQGLGGNPLGPRYSGQFYGLLFAFSAAAIRWERFASKSLDRLP